MIQVPAGSSRARGDARDHLIETARPGEIDGAQRLAKSEEVDVGIGNAGNDGGAGQIDDARLRAAQRLGAAA